MRVSPSLCFSILSSLLFLAPPAALRAQTGYEGDGGLFGQPAAGESYGTEMEPDYFQVAQNEPDQMRFGQGTPALNGFAEIPWETSFSEARTRFRALATSASGSETVEIVNQVENDHILVRRNGILYRYSFYRTPYPVARLQRHDLTEEEHDQEEALLFHVKVILPFIRSDLIKEKLVEKFGRNTSSTVDPNKHDGADVWELNGGLIFQWYEPYNQTAYTRTIDYMSRSMAERILAEYADYFDAAEKLLLQDVILQ
ncbi:MAG: hypothetical protein KDK35_11695 [Leptospiraceae bacterium]|nr:hypothetical protein [Leptospiraceae bacterium]MCP5486829.1 hypothetical protein [Spirochaetales bacterium]